jgi:type II secretory pathway component GspD/PulD (secretin)
LLAGAAAQAQDETVRPESARQALRLAIEAYRKNDYDTAKQYLAIAQAGRQSLTAPSQQDLDNFSAQTDLALKNRNDSGTQFRAIEDAIQQGRTAEAGSLLNTLNANPSLTPADRDRLADLNRKLQAKLPSPAPAVKGDAKSMLKDGRLALQAGDLNAAETWAEQAEKASGGTSWLQAFGDSPAKLRRDIQAARAKQAPPAPPAKKEEPKESSSSSWLPSMKWFGKSDKPAQPENPPKEAPKGQDSPGVPVGGFWPFGGAKKDPTPNNFDDKMARQLVADGYKALAANDVKMATLFAIKAKTDHPVQYAPGEPTPDTLLQEIQRVTANPNAPSALAPKKNDPTDPRDMLRLGRTLVGQKKFDEAEKWCTQAASAKDARWGLFEDTPDKLRKDILRLRQTNDREESYKVMADARKLFATGQYEEAEKKAYLAKKMHGPYGVFDFGDRPDKLLEEIQRARPTKGPSVNGDQIAKKDNKVEPNKDVPPTTLPAEAIAAKNRAIVMVREARELERQGNLIEARNKAHEARGLKAPFSPEEDSPEHVIGSVTAAAERQIQSMLQQATEQAGSAGDAQRFAKAGAMLTGARQLAQAFGLDSGRIEQASHYVQQVASGNPVRPLGMFANPADAPTGDPQRDAARKVAREKLQHAQTELTHGNTGTARKICEQLAREPQHGLQEDVLRLLRTIGAEERNQQMLQAKRTFDAGLDAFVQKDYRRAMTIFQNIDPMMLPEQYHARMRDIMATREMQPQHFLQAGHQEVLKGQPIDPKKNPGVAVNPLEKDNFIEDHKAKEIVQFQALRQRGVEALRQAGEQFKQKDQKERAVDTLKNYIEQVNVAQLEPAKANELRRLPDARIAQYRMMMDQDKLTDREKRERFTSYWDEGKHQRDISKTQEEVYQKMKLVHELMKQNKNKEADAEIAKVLEIDRENVAARAAKSIVQTRMKQEAWDKDEHDNWKFFEMHMPHKLGPLPSDNRPIEFNAEITQRRNKPGANEGGIQWQNKDPKERAIEYRLKQPISLNLRDVPLRQALKDVSIQSGIPVIPDLGPLAEARVNLDAPLSIDVPDIDMKSALNIMLSPLKLTYIIEDQVLKVTTENRTAKRNIRVTYPVADLVIAVENHPLPDVYRIDKALERSMSPNQFAPNYLTTPPYGFNNGTPVASHGGGLGASDPGHSPGNEKKTPERLAHELINLIKNAVQKQSWEDLGGNGGIQYFGPAMALVINQPQEVQEEVQQLLQSLRKLQDLQVSVELRAVLVSETFFERIGMDFDMNIRTPTSRREPDLVNGTFVPAPFINRTADKLGGLISGLTSAGTFTPDLNIPIRNSTFNFTTPQFGGYQPEAGLSLGLAFLSDIQVFMFLEAVQGDRRAHIMQAPKLTVFNGQQATIGGLMLRPSVTGLNPAALGNGTMIMTPNITQIPFGLTMTVQPVVSPDRRFIRLNVTPQAAQGTQDPAGAIVIAVPGTVAGTFDGGGAQPPFANNPLNVTIVPTNTNLFLANTTVNVPDGGTVLLGGFKFLAEERSEYGPPILSKIPYLSRLFRNVGWSRDGSTLIYLITARVIMVEEEEGLFLGTIAPIPGR